MNEKKAKMLRKAMRHEGVPPRETAYNAELPYFSAPLAWNEHLKQVVRAPTLKPLRLNPGCGRFKYKVVKTAFQKQFK